MTLIQYALASLFGILLASGQILFKIAADQKNTDGSPYSIMKIIGSIPMVSACSLYAITIILYVYLLQQLPLSRAYLFSMIGSAIVPVLAIIIFKEDFSVRYILGFIMIISGVALTTTT